MYINIYILVLSIFELHMNGLTYTVLGLLIAHKCICEVHPFLFKQFWVFSFSFQYIIVLYEIDHHLIFFILIIWGPLQ